MNFCALCLECFQLNGGGPFVEAREMLENGVVLMGDAFRFEDNSLEGSDY